jgi:hypothetical protein
MKKLLVFLFTIATVYAAEAQNFGIRAGANLSNLAGDLTDDSRFNNKLGYHVGLTANFPIVEDFFSIQPELLYTNKGFKNNPEDFERNGIRFTREGSVNFNYLELPVLARINAGPLYFEAGPQASYLLGIRDNTEQTPLISTGDRITPDGMNRFELGYVAGIGFGMPRGISAGVRYTSSFNRILNDTNNNNPNFFDGDLRNARHSVFMFTLAFAFGNR